MSFFCPRNYAERVQAPDMPLILQENQTGEGLQVQKLQLLKQSLTLRLHRDKKYYLYVMINFLFKSSGFL